MAGKPGRSGPTFGVAQPGRATNGTSLIRLKLGELPAPMKRQLGNIRAYRRGLEDLVMESKGEVNSRDAHLIDEAATAEQHAAICRWLIRTKLKAMAPTDIARCSEQILKAKTIRNKAVERLQIDRDRKGEVLEALYRKIEDQT